MCAINLPPLPGAAYPSGMPTSAPTLTPEPYTIGGTLQQIPNAMIGNYEPCNISTNLDAALTFVDDASLPFSAIISYILGCGIVSLVTKLKKKNAKKG